MKLQLTEIKFAPIILAWLLLCACPFLHADLAKRNGVNLSGLAKNNGVNIAAGSGPTYAFHETFEGTGYSNAGVWTTANGTPDPDYTTDPITGAQSLELADNDFLICDLSSFSLGTEVWVYIQFRCSDRLESQPSGAIQILLRDTDDATAMQCRYFGSNAPTTPSTDHLDYYHGTDFQDDFPAYSVPTHTGNGNHALWFHWKSASVMPGSDGEMRGGQSAEDSLTNRPAWQKEETGKTYEGEIDEMLLRGAPTANGPATFIFDEIIIHTSEFTSV